MNKQKNTVDGPIQGMGETLNKDVDLILEENIKALEALFRSPRSTDLITRRFLAGGVPASILYLEGMSDGQLVNRYVLEPLMHSHLRAVRREYCLQVIPEEVLTLSDIETIGTLDDVVHAILGGKSVLLLDGLTQALSMETRGYEKRGVDKTSIESVILGPQEGFTENLRTNVTLIRRIVRAPRLVTELLPLGRGVQNSCALLYLDGIAPAEVVAEAKRRIAALDIDSVPGSGFLAQLLEDHPYSILPQILSTERPDRASSFLMEGQIIIVVDGSPFVLAAPAGFFHFIHTSDDAYMRWQYGSYIRIIRIIGMLMGVFLPGIYIALTLFHADAIPVELLIAIAETHANVPFPMVIEILIMELSFDLLHEAGTRIPGLMGSALGIVGGLILGQAAVSASVISPIVIIIVALTGLGNFAIPDYSLGIAVRLLRLIFIFTSAIAGFFGMSIALFIIGLLFCAQTSFGVPYLQPVAPDRIHNPDILLRGPLFKQTLRGALASKPYRKHSKGSMRNWQRRK